MKKALPVLLVMLFFFVVVVGFVTYYIQESLAPINNQASTAWWNSNWSYRLPITVNSGVFERSDLPVQKELNFTQFLVDLEQTAAFDSDSLRIVEVNQAGTTIDQDVVFQFDPAVDYNEANNAKGTLIWLMNNTTAPNSSRYFQIYFDLKSKNHPPADVDALVVTVDDVDHKGFESIKTTTEDAEYYFHKDGGGFATLIDSENKDWINWNSATGSLGQFRGIPNMVHPNDGGYFHPGKTDNITTLISTGPIKTTFMSKSKNLEWEAIWEIYPNFANMTVKKIPDKKYWFLYEGTPGGTFELNNDRLTRSDNTSINASEEWTTDIQGEEWVYVSDGTVNRSLFLINHQEDEHIDGYRDQDNMTVFGFGRNQGNRYLTGINKTFTIGLIDSKEFNTVKKEVQSIYKSVTITTSDPEAFDPSEPTEDPGFTNTPTVTPSEIIPSDTPRETPSHTPTFTPSVTPSATPTEEFGDTPVNTPTPTDIIISSATPIEDSPLPNTPTPTIYVGTVCGKSDVTNDGMFTLVDFSAYAEMYGIGNRECTDTGIDYGVCGGRDVDRDGDLDLTDFGGENIGFAQRYYPRTSCALSTD